MITYLEREDPSKNSRRFYALQVTQTIFGSWALIRIWGRIGHQGGTRLESWFDREHKARDAAIKIQRTPWLQVCGLIHFTRTSVTKTAHLLSELFISH